MAWAWLAAGVVVAGALILTRVAALPGLGRMRCSVNLHRQKREVNLRTTTDYEAGQR
ncbi:MAG: hypothetical protein ACLSH1_05890 [Clostridia bacterium]